MKKINHIIFFLTTFLLWFGFYLLGKPFNYFIDFSLSEILLLMLVTFFAIVPFITITLLVAFAQDYFRESIWLSFYASIPLFIYDYITVGIIEKQGFTFLKSHWYLTLGYFLVWIFIPIVGVTLKKLKQHAERYERIRPTDGCTNAQRCGTDGCGNGKDRRIYDADDNRWNYDNSNKIGKEITSHK